MSMSKKFALLGFLPDIERRAKQLIESNMETPVDWVSATDASVQGVIINAIFLETPQVQKYIHKTKANVVYCYNDRSKQQVIGLGVSGIHLTRHSNEELKHWIALLTGETTVPLPVRLPVKQPLQSKQSDASTLATSLRAGRPIQSTATLTSKNDSRNLSKDYRMLLKLAKQPNVFLYAKSGNKETWICTSKNQAYINYKRDSIPKIDKLSWKQQNSLQKQGKTQCIKLQMWLFESIWQSQLPVGPGL